MCCLSETTYPFVRLEKLLQDRRALQRGMPADALEKQLELARPPLDKRVREAVADHVANAPLLGQGGDDARGKLLRERVVQERKVLETLARRHVAPGKVRETRLGAHAVRHKGLGAPRLAPALARGTRRLGPGVKDLHLQRAMPRQRPRARGHRGGTAGRITPQSHVATP